MKTIRWLSVLVLILAECAGTSTTQQPALQTGRKGCRIVDEVSTKTGALYYVDGIKVPGNLGVLGGLRQREKVSPCNCLLAFVTSSATIRDVEDLRVIAGKMDYKEFHAYLYDERYRDFATEIFYYGSHLDLNELRSGPQGQVALPGGGLGKN